MIKGSLVAIVSPMREDGSLDYDAYRRLIDWHIAEGTNGIVASAARANRRRWITTSTAN